MAKYQGDRPDLFKAIQSLVRRGIIEKLTIEVETTFAVSPVLQQYVKMTSEYS